MASQKLINAVQALFGSAFAISRGYSSIHDAVDIKAGLGTKLRTVDGGTVSYAEDARDDTDAHALKHWAKGGGRVVNIDIDSKRTIQYAHLDTISVRVGDKVERGRLIGTVGKTGNATGPHVHFGLWRHGVGMIDPTDYLAGLAGQSPVGAAVASTPVPTAKVTVLERYAPARQFTVPAGSTVRAFDPGRPGTVIRQVDFPGDSRARALAKVFIEWPNQRPEPVPHGTFYQVADGAFAGLYVKVQQVRLEAATMPAPDTNGSTPTPVGTATTPSHALISVVEQYDPERHFEVPPGTTIRGFDPARPGKVIRESTFANGSGAHASAMVVIAWPGMDPQPVPHGTFLAVSSGLFEGLYIKAQLVALDPIPQSPAELDAERDAEREGAVA